MTVLGKILVFVNLVFSLLTAFLVITVFVTRTNWHAQNDKLKADLEAVGKRAQAYKDETEEARRDATVKMDSLTKEIARLQEENTFAKKEHQKLEALMAANSTNVEVAGLSANKSTVETERLRSEFKGLEEKIAQRDAKVGDLEKQLKDTEEKRILAEIELQSQNQRNKDLLGQVAGLTQDLEKSRSGRGGVATTSSSGYLTEGATNRPPPADIRAEVRTVDKTGLITINAGSDNGLAKGHELQVFRMKPEPKYLGTVRIVATDPHAAVGRPSSSWMRPGSIQKGDIVASRILGPQ